MCKNNGLTISHSHLQNINNNIHHYLFKNLYITLSLHDREKKWVKQNRLKKKKLKLSANYSEAEHKCSGSNSILFSNIFLMGFLTTIDPKFKN